MPPSINDKFGKASVDTDYAQATTVKTARTAGEAVLTGFDLSKFSDETPAYFLTYKKSVDPVTDKVIITKRTSWKALVNKTNNTLTNLTLAPGYTDVGNEVGDFIECIPSSMWVNDLVNGIKTSSNPDGTLKNDIVTTAKIANNAITTAKIVDMTSGSNANGRWQKFPDGMMIVTRDDLVVGAPVAASGSVIYYGPRTPWTFPAAFIAPPVCSASFDGGPGDMWAVAVDPTTTNAQVALFCGRTRTGTYNCRATAIGRWK